MPLAVVSCRAARALLDWSINDLAAAADVGVMTVTRFERGETVREASIGKIADAFASAGIAFIAAGDASQNGGEGVRFSLKSPADER